MGAERGTFFKCAAEHLVTRRPPRHAARMRKAQVPFLMWSILLTVLLPARAAERFLQRSWLSEDGLPGNFVRSVVQASDRFLWVATAEGVVRFDGVRFTVPGGEMDRGIARMRPKMLFPFPDGSVWIATEAGGLIRWKARTWTLIWPASSQPGTAEVIQVVPEPDGSALIVRAQEVWRIVGVSPPVLLSHVPPASAARAAADAAGWRDQGRLPPGASSLELKDRQGRRWHTGPNRELFLDERGQPTMLVLPGGSGVTSMTEDHEGNLWVALDTGGLRCLRERRVEMLQEATRQSASTCILQDRAGVIWIGDRNGGVDRVEQDRTTTLKLSDGSTQRAVCVLFEDSTGRLWAATRDGSLFLQREGQFVSYAAGPPLSKVNAMAEDAAGKLWIGGAYGLAVLHGETVTTHAPAESFNGRVSTLLITPDQQMWLGTSDGAIYHGPVGRPDSPSLDKAAMQLAAGSRISSLFYDSDGHVWATTHGAGLLRHSPGTGWSIFNDSSGLPDLRLTAVLEDTSRHLWIGSLGGIFRLRRGDADSPAGLLLPWLRLDRSDGLTTRECTGYTQPSAWRARDETLYFPTSRGVAQIRQETLRTTPPPDPVIETATAGEAAVFPASTGATRLQAGPGRQRLEFRFTVPSFSAPEKIRFRTRLIGLDDAWRESGPVRMAAYDAVPHGAYEFQVTATDGDGTPGSIARFPVTVPPQWWETLLFRTAVVLLLAGAATATGFLLARQRARRRIARLQFRHAQETERSRIARDLHDDLGASLTEISLLACLSAEEAPVGPHRTSLETIASRAQNVVGTLDEIVWAVDPRHDTSASLVEYLSAWGQEFLARAGITLLLDIPRDLRDFPMEAERRHALFLAVREALHNIMKHSATSIAWLRMRGTAHSLTVIVEDTGKGFDPATAPSGHGLGNYQERMKTCGGTVTLTTAPGEGTRLEFRLPLLPA